MALSAAGLASGLAGAGSVAFSSIVADGSTPGLSTDGTSALGLAVSSDAGVSVLGLVASADAGASVLGLAVSADARVSVLGAGRSVSAELAEKAVPASADGTSLSSIKPARLLAVPEVPPPPDVSAFNAGNYIARSSRGTL